MTREQEQLGSDLENWGRDPALSELDALMWRTDRHPQGAWSGVVLQLLDTVPDWERLRAAHEWFVEIVPRFAQRVVDPLLPVGPPMWADDPSFDLDFHLRRVSLPAPGTHRQLLELAQTIGLTPLDRSRPPWEGYLVEGLEDGHAAYIMHAHHVFMDGLALARLHERVLNTSRKHQADKPTPARKPPEERWRTLPPRLYARPHWCCGAAVTESFRSPRGASWQTPFLMRGWWSSMTSHTARCSRSPPTPQL